MKKHLNLLTESVCAVAMSMCIATHMNIFKKHCIEVQLYAHTWSCCTHSPLTQQEKLIGLFAKSPSLEV